MRRSGQTTRKIDEAIQVLFNEGYIKLPSLSHIKDGTAFRGVKEECIIIDNDAHITDNAQKDLFKRIVNRLMFEHNIQHRKEFTVKHGDRTIRYNQNG